MISSCVGDGITCPCPFQPSTHRQHLHLKHQIPQCNHVWCLVQVQPQLQCICHSYVSLNSILFASSLLQIEYLPQAQALTELYQIMAIIATSFAVFAFIASISASSDEHFKRVNHFFSVHYSFSLSLSN